MNITLLGQALTVVGTLGGVWGVFFLFRWFQHDFVAANRRELEEERKRADTADQIADAERRLRITKELRISHLERLLVTNGIPIPKAEE